MPAFQPYLNFDGATRDAMTFYHQCLGGELTLQSFADSGMEGPPGSADRIMHANLRVGSAVLMASDTMPGMPFTPGNNVHINIDCDTAEEQARCYKALSEGGHATMPLQDTFWGARFGMLVDRYGVQWMLNYTIPPEE